MLSRFTVKGQLPAARTRRTAPGRRRRLAPGQGACRTPMGGSRRRRGAAESAAKEGTLSQGHAPLAT